jgi:U4/U6.U5 tri-snRNP-associated protein 2
MSMELSDLVESAIDVISKSNRYDLVANIIHESPPDVGREGKHDPLLDGSYKCHVKNRGTQQWYEIQDFHVQEVLPQQIGISESYVLIFERNTKRFTDVCIGTG